MEILVRSNKYETLHCQLPFVLWQLKNKTKIARGTKNANRRFERCCKVEITNHNIALKLYYLMACKQSTPCDNAVELCGGGGIFMPLTLGAIIGMFIIYCYCFVFLNITAAVCRCSCQLRLKSQYETSMNQPFLTKINEKSSY